MDLSPVADALHVLFQGICHQQPERSFSPGGLQLPLCARCSGIWENAFIALAVLFGYSGLRGKRPGRILMTAAFAALSLFILETARSMVTGHSVANPFRYLVGACGGFFIAVFLVQLHRMLQGQNDTPDRRAQTTALALYLVILVILWAALYANHLSAWILHAAITTAAVFAVIGGINYVLIGGAMTMVHRPPSRFSHIAASVALAVGEIGVLSFVIR